MPRPLEAFLDWPVSGRRDEASPPAAQPDGIERGNLLARDAPLAPLTQAALAALRRQLDEPWPWIVR